MTSLPERMSVVLAMPAVQETPTFLVLGLDTTHEAQSLTVSVANEFGFGQGGSVSGYKKGILGVVLNGGRVECGIVGGGLGSR